MAGKLEKYLADAKKSSFGLRKLNFGLGRMIPFNKPHGIKIHEIGDNYVKTIIPYKRKNLNHIKGIHACGMATAAEFASGFMLLTKLGPKNYRLIMQSLEMEYHYQAKMTAIATYGLDVDWLQEHVVQFLKENDAVTITCEIKIEDTAGNHLATGKTKWQIKSWDKVKTKV